MRIYHCERCGNMTVMLHDAGVQLYCCNSKMCEPRPHFSVEGCDHEAITDADGDKFHILIGKKSHPMERDHRIEWISVKTDQGFFIRYLKPSEKPEAEFLINGNFVVQKVYYWCNKNGLWEKDIAKLQIL